MDNYGTHKTKLISDWFLKRPRWHVHYTPTSASWINQAERLFAQPTERALKRGVFRSVAELEAAYIKVTNRDPKPSLDQDRRRYPRQHPALLPSNTRRKA
jgi:hypothetical protein